jgi:sulfur relay (sulfurtransferase) complex TusBCD TusD component (DsrE family)
VIVTAGDRRSQPVEKDINHSHHWMIETQDGPASSAVCRTCGDKRDFENAYRWPASSKARPAPSPPPEPRIEE